MTRDIKLAPLRDAVAFDGRRKHALEWERDKPYLDCEERLVYFFQDGKTFAISPDNFRYLEFTNEDDN